MTTATVVGVTVTIGASPARAASSASQQWLTNTTGTVTGVGGSLNAIFGSSGLTASITVTAATGAPAWPQGHSTSIATVGGAMNAATFLEPDPPSASGSIVQGVGRNISIAEVITFSKPVLAPILHIDNIDGSSVTISGSTTTGQPIRLSTVAKNSALSVNGNQLNTPRPASQAGCQADDGGNPYGGCGSFALGGASGMIRSFTLVNAGQFGDGWGWTLSLPVAPLTKSFTPDKIDVGDTSQLTFTVDNSANSSQPPLGPLDFADALPAGLTLADGTVTSSPGCGASPTITDGGGAALRAGDTAISVGDLSLAAGSTCTITVSVTAGIGTYVNGNNRLSTTVANLEPSANATLTVVDHPTITVLKVVAGRLNAADQFTVGLQDSTGSVLASTSTSGIATMATTGAITVHGGQTYTVTDALSAGSASALSNYTPTIACTDATTGGAVATGGTAGSWTLAVTGPDAYNCVVTNSPILNPSTTVTKTVSPIGPVHPGQVVTYRLLVQSTGPVGVPNAQVIDHLNDVFDDAVYNNDATAGVTRVGLNAVRWIGPLAAQGSPGDSKIITYSVTVKNPDTGNGVLVNSVSTNGCPSAHTPGCSTTSPVQYYTLSKSSDAAGKVPGNTVHYAVRVTNDSHTDYTASDPATFSDDLSDVLDDAAYNGDASAGAEVSGSTLTWSGPLAAGATETVTYSVTLKSADSGNESLTNLVTPSSADGGSCATADSCFTSTDLPGLTLVKTADPTTIDHVGQTIAYTYTLSNVGLVPLTDVEVDETAFSGTGAAPTPSCPQPTLAPGDSEDCAATYTVTQADVDAGSVTNTAVGQARLESADVSISSGESSATVDAEASPALTVVKSAEAVSAAQFVVGHVVTYSFVLTNTGNVTLSDVHPVEGGFTGHGPLSAPQCPASAQSLAPGDAVTCTTSYTITAADLDQGDLVNTAVGAGTPPGGSTPVDSPPSTATVPHTPELTTPPTSTPPSSIAPTTAAPAPTTSPSSTVSVEATSATDPSLASTGVAHTRALVHASLGLVTLGVLLIVGAAVRRRRRT